MGYEPKSSVRYNVVQNTFKLPSLSESFIFHLSALKLFKCNQFEFWNAFSIPKIVSVQDLVWKIN